MAAWIDRVYRELEIGSEQFLEICQALDGLPRDPSAEWRFDGMSGAFKFDDEIPRALWEQPSELVLPCVDLLRCVWGYRISVVRNAHRTELFEFMRAVWLEAPNWPGLHPDRFSSAMIPVANECERRAIEFTEGLDEVDRRINEQRRLKREQGPDPAR